MCNSVYLDKCIHPGVEVSDEVKHGGASGGDELLAHSLQPPINLGKYIKKCSEIVALISMSLTSFLESLSCS